MQWKDGVGREGGGGEEGDAVRGLSKVLQASMDDKYSMRFIYCLDYV